MILCIDELKNKIRFTGGHIKKKTKQTGQKTIRSKTKRLRQVLISLHKYAFPYFLTP